MSKPSVPTPASPSTVSSAQTGSNVDTAIANATLGNINQSNPYGSTTYTQNGTTSVDGYSIPSYSETTSLNPTLQSILTGTENTAASLLPTAQGIANNIQPNGVNNQIIQSGPQATNQAATSAIFAGDKALLQPIYTQQSTDLTDQLARQGIPIGSQAYNSAESNLAANQNSGYTSALGSATQSGVTSANNMYNLALLGAQAPINQLASLYGGTGASSTSA